MEKQTKVVKKDFVVCTWVMLSTSVDLSSKQYNCIVLPRFASVILYFLRLLAMHVFKSFLFLHEMEKTAEKQQNLHCNGINLKICHSQRTIYLHQS